jgi:thiosulfate dehydrogenase [quinone] large subunit
MAVKSNALNSGKVLYLLAVARIMLGLTFLWAFFDKLLGLGFATCRDAKTDSVTMLCEKAWVHGGSPTLGYLKFATKGPLASFYQNLAGNWFVDTLFMSAMLLIGLALIAGIGMKVATASAVTFLVMIWTAQLLPENNPLIDEHVIYSVVLLAILSANSNQKLGLGSWWRKQQLVKRFSILE